MEEETPHLSVHMHGKAFIRGREGGGGRGEGKEEGSNSAAAGMPGMVATEKQVPT